MTISMQDFPLPVIKHGNGKTHHPLIDDFPINTLLFQKCFTAMFYYQWHISILGLLGTC